MGFTKKSWISNYAKLIGLVEMYPIIYQIVPKNHRNPRSKIKSIWRDISIELNVPAKNCIKRWWIVKTRYAKLKKLVLSGKVLEEEIKNNPKTLYFMEGALTFLDPYIQAFSDDDIPPFIHKYYNNLFNVKETQQNPVPDNVSQNINKEKAITSLNLGLQSELIIEEDHIKTESDNEEFVEDSPIEIAESPSNEIIESQSLEIMQLYDYENEVQHILPDNPISTFDVRSIVIENVQGSIPETYVSDKEMIQFFTELGKTLSSELSLKKQKMLQERINALLIKENILLTE